MSRTAARGYGSAHRKLRAYWSPIVASGVVVCWRCGIHIAPLERWDLGHDDHDRSQYRGPEHIKCNRATDERRHVDPQPRTNSDW